MQTISTIFLILFFAAFAGIIKPYIGGLTRWQFAVAALVSALICGATVSPPPQSPEAANSDGSETTAPKPQSDKTTQRNEETGPNEDAAATVLSDEELAERIDADAISSYGEADRSIYPDLFKKLGDRVFEVESLGRKAAHLAIRNGECDRVLYVDVSGRSSRDELQFFVDCENETRVRVSEAQIAEGQIESSETREERERKVASQMMREDRLISKAKASVRAVLRDPSSADFGNVFVSEKEGLVTCGYVNARNGFGGMSGKQGFIAFSNRIATQTDAEFGPLWKKHCSI